MEVNHEEDFIKFELAYLQWRFEGLNATSAESLCKTWIEHHAKEFRCIYDYIKSSKTSPICPQSVLDNR